MKKLIASKWFAVGIGVILFLATIFLFPSAQSKHEEKKADAKGTNGVPESVAGSHTNATAKAAELDSSLTKPIVNLADQPAVPLATQVGEPGSLSFNNPEVNKLVDDLRRERLALKAREEELTRLAQRVTLDKTEIASITQEVIRFKAAVENALTNGLTQIKTNEIAELRKLANIYTIMPPANAVLILDKMSVDEIAKILEFMKEKDKAAILENFATNTNLSKVVDKATEISRRIRRLSPEPQLPSFQSIPK